jgi:Flp pilus assembly protein TadG
MVALIAVTLFGMAAFAVDAGSAYNAKRQLSTSADAASLAGAAALEDYSGNCTTVSNNAAAQTAAQNAGDSYRTRNRSSSTRVGFGLACSSDSKAVEVMYQNTDTVNTVFGKVFGVSSLNATRDATATIEVPPDAPGLRPYMICTDDLNKLNTGGIQTFPFPNALCGNQSGNWYTIDCPAFGGSNSTAQLAQVTISGCPSDIHIIDTSSVATVPLKDALLISTCQAAEAAQGTKLTAKPGCLTANTGNLASNNLEDAWRYLIGVASSSGATLSTPVQPKSILLPVFLTGSVINPGNSAVYPVYAFVGATVCGYHWQNKEGVSNLGDCVGTPAWAAGNYDAIKLVKATVLVSGSTGSRLCALGASDCDFGARRVRLVK